MNDSTDSFARHLRLTKGRLLAWKQCPKRLYLEVYHPQRAVEDEQAQHWIAMGREVGRVARELHPGGILINDCGVDPTGGDQGQRLQAALQQTRALLDQAAAQPATAIGPLFEAAFQVSDGQGEVLILADIVAMDPAGLVLREVKSSARVKDTHLDDCAIQAWVMAQAGYGPARVELAHVDSAFVYRQPGNYRGLIVSEDITRAVAAITEAVPDWIGGARHTLQGPVPGIQPGLQCSQPHACPFMGHCWQHSAEYPVSALPDKGAIVADLQARGIDDIRDIPADALTRPLQQRVREATVSGRPFLDPQAGETMRALPYPRYYLDFETVQFAVPIWLDTRPFEQLPFQWSCHVERAPGELEHAEFLDTSGAAPMRVLTEQLLAVLGTHGPVFTYSSFERRLIKEQARRFPDLAGPLSALLNRLVDLQKIAKQHYYHPAMKGSWSIKAVLPTVAPELDYSQLDGVQNGTQAQMAYRACIDEGVSTERRRQLEATLRAYCRLDTLAMVRLAEFLAG